MINNAILESDQQNHIQELLEDSFNKIPDELLKCFTNRSIKETKLINKDVNSAEFKQIAYAIYRAYCIGFILQNKL